MKIETIQSFISFDQLLFEILSFKFILICKFQNGPSAGADSDGGPRGPGPPLSDHTAIIKLSGPIFHYRVEIMLLFLYLFLLLSMAASVFVIQPIARK